MTPMTSTAVPARSRLGGMFTRRERWGLSWRGWLMLVAGAVILAFGTVRGVYPFFAVTAPVESRYLAMEGWIDTYAVRATLAEFNARGYERVFTTGGPIPGLSGDASDYNTVAHFGSNRLRALGAPASAVQSVPSRAEARDRTYEAAVALWNWCRDHQVALTSVNVVTVDVHARRTRLLFEKALGSQVKVGIISIPNPDYPAARWYRYSQGVRAVIGEMVAYVYAKFFFFP